MDASLEPDPDPDSELEPDASVVGDSVPELEVVDVESADTPLEVSRSSVSASVVESLPSDASPDLVVERPPSVPVVSIPALVPVETPSLGVPQATPRAIDVKLRWRRRSRITARVPSIAERPTIQIESTTV